MSNWKAWLQALGALVLAFAAATISYGTITQQWNTNTLWAGAAAVVPSLLTLLKANPWAGQLAAIQQLNLTATATGDQAKVTVSSGMPIPNTAPATVQPVTPATAPALAPAPASTGSAVKLPPAKW